MTRSATLVPTDLDTRAARAEPLVVDETTLASARERALAYVESGRPYFLAPRFTPARVAVARRAAGDILRQIADPDERRAAFEALATGGLVYNGHPVTAYVDGWHEDAGLRETIARAAGLHARSNAERARIEALVGYVLPRVEIAPRACAFAPREPARPDARGVVLWAPHADAADLGVALYALADLHEPALVVCRGVFPDMPHRFFRPERAREALAEAAAIVDADAIDPGAALAFAGLGYGLVCAGTSGAHEYLDGVAVYDAWDSVSLRGAVSRARARRTVAVRGEIDVAAPHDAPVVVHAGAGIAEATADAAERLATGAPVVVAPRLLPGYAARAPELDGRDVAALRGLMQLADLAVFRSHTEREYVERSLGRRRPCVAISATPDPAAPRPAARPEARGVLLYAPNANLAELDAYRAALADFAPACFCRETADVAEAAFARSAVIVACDLADPGAALAFADLGYGLVCASTSGAHEYVDGVVQYLPWDAASLRAAVERAFAHRDATRRAAPVPRPRGALADAVRAALPAIPTAPPLVSVVIPTYNRKRMIRGTLGSLARQSYPNIEIVVANDCGEDLAETLRDFPNARQVTAERNAGPLAAINMGFAASRGAYIGTVPDDDALYPHAIARGVEALRHANLAVAHGDAVFTWLERLDAENFAVHAYHVEQDADIDPYERLWRVPAMTLLGLLVRREAFAAVGGFSPEFTGSGDNHFILKLLNAYDFAHVPFVCATERCRTDGMRYQHTFDDIAIEMERMWRTIAPIDRPKLRERQLRWFSDVANARRAEAARPANDPATFPVPRRLARPRGFRFGD